MRNNILTILSNISTADRHCNNHNLQWNKQHNTPHRNNRLQHTILLPNNSAILYIISSVFSYLQSFFLTDISVSISYNLRLKIMNKITALSIEDIDENKRGDILSRMTNDVDSLQTGITHAFLQMLTAIITIIGVFIMMLYINIWMTLATIILIPISFLMIITVTKYS